MLWFRKQRIEELSLSAEAYILLNYVRPEPVEPEVPGRRYSIETPDWRVLDREDAMREFMQAVQREENLNQEFLDQFLMRVTERTFSQMVAIYIAGKRLKDSAVYKAANMNRQLFSKIMTDVNFHPSKDTALALVFGLRLTLPEAEDLLRRAGYALSKSDRRDLVIEYFIRSKTYDIPAINMTLEKMGMKIIGR